MECSRARPRRRKTDHQLLSGCREDVLHVCDVEVDPETGHVTIMRYTAAQASKSHRSPQSIARRRGAGGDRG
jgi:hypothetical protein